MTQRMAVASIEVVTDLKPPNWGNYLPRISIRKSDGQDRPILKRHRLTSDFLARDRGLRKIQTLNAELGI
jgi:hypothetical protein